MPAANTTAEVASGNNISSPTIDNNNNKKKKSPKKEKKLGNKSLSRRKMPLGTTIPSRAAEHEAGNSFMEDYERFHETMVMLDAIEGKQEMSTEESSDALSSINSTISSEFGNYEVIEYDLNDPDGPFYHPDYNGNNYLNLSPSVINKKATTTSTDGASILPDLLIEDNSPAAAALRANANVHVSTASKAARAVHLQTIRRFAKFAAGANKTGYVKGKPPRLPPSHRRRIAEGPFGAPGRIHETESIDEGLEGEENSIEDKSDNRNGETSGDDEALEQIYGHTSSFSDGEGGVSEEDEIQVSTPVRRPSGGTNDNSLIPAETNEPKQQQEDSKIEPVPVYQDVESHNKQKLDLAMMRATATSMAHIPDGVAPGTIEAGKKVLGNVDPHDLLKLQRWRKKNKGQSSVKKSYVKGKVIDGEHELYTLSIAVMIGVRQSISRTNFELGDNKGKRWVKIQDFRTTEKYEFRPKGDGTSPPHLLAHTFKFKDYSPIVFAYLRRMYGVNEFDFLLSVCGNANFIEFISNAKSGQFFFYSSDGRYMIKTMTNAESKFLRRILPQYFKHCSENPNTMMTRFFGMYRVKLYHLRRNVKFVIMNSVYYTDKPLQSFYDLKGSSVGRDAKPGQAVLKDNDLRRSLPDGALAIKQEQWPPVRKQVESDCDFLQEMEIMDYSMLVGVHHLSHQQHLSRQNARLHKEGSVRGLRSNGDNVQHSPSQAAKPPLSPLSPSKEADLSRTGNTKPSHRRKPSLKNLSFDDGLDDDDSSYLLGSAQHPSSAGNASVASNEDTERKKLATIEKLYWPFHTWFDIHGYRRMKPADAPYNTFSDEDLNILKGYNIPAFVPPLSDRKDGGFEMDTTGLSLPMLAKEASGEERYCDGKIFYMGIIDILQEYTARKSLETTYRSFLNSAKGGEVSCVPPISYAGRFVNFFEEFSKRTNTSNNKDNEESSSTRAEL